MVGKTKIMETSYPAASISDNDVSFSNKRNSKNKAKENDEKYNDDIGKDPLYAKSRLREWTKNRLYELRQKQRILKHDYILKTEKERKEAERERRRKRKEIKAMKKKLMQVEEASHSTNSSYGSTQDDNLTLIHLFHPQP